MTESTIDMDRAMQGIDCEVITWTKCSDRMPPDDSTDVICKWFQNGVRKLELCTGAHVNYSLHQQHAGHIEWTPYTPEGWAELNRK